MTSGIKVNMKGFTIDKLNELERISDINMVNYYKYELDKLDRGLNYDIKISGKRMLRKRDIIYYKLDRPSYKRTCLTPKGKAILDSIK